MLESLFIGRQLRKRYYGTQIKLVRLAYHLIPILRRYSMIHLEKAKLLELLKENGGAHVFAESWAAVSPPELRHGFSSRVATSKIREAPENFEKKRDVYTRIN